MSERPGSSRMAVVWLLIGLVVGVGFGLVLDNTVVGLLLGLVFGGAIAIGSRVGGRRTADERDPR